MMRRPRLPFCIVALGAFAACSEPPSDSFQRKNVGNGSEEEGPPPGGELPDEQFPAELLEPYTGPPIDEYDNTVLGYVQLRSRVKQVFADTGIGGNTDAYFASKISLLGGADFTTTFSEARVATPDFLLALDGIAKDSCARAASNKTGPFAGTNPAAVAAGGEAALATQLYSRILVRAPTAGEVKDGVDLVARLRPMSPDATSAWAGLCEALVRHPDALFTLPPSVASATGADKERLQTVKLAMDFAGRLPTDEEFASLAGKTVPEKVDFYVGTPEFRDFYFHRARVRTESVGTPESDEPARLWTYLVLSGAPMQEVLTADYSVDPSFAKVPRAAEHGASGVLTMPGFIKTKPGLPHYNYSARVMTDYMGQLFEVTPEIIAGRLSGQVSSTVEPGSSCIVCHGVLTPLEHQRLAWADNGTFRTVDEKGAPIDDTDRGMVPDYPYKGKGMPGFATLAVRKEKFFRQTFQAQFLFFVGRQMRYAEDERTTYLALWKNAWANNGNMRELMKVIASQPRYLGN
ncbi:MAG TPA: hypothetical protein VM925_09940 [Labilithrix sp.]|nr:hypothetical protein [Labilithrix sp.]